jgi:hypothetical protein
MTPRHPLAARLIVLALAATVVAKPHTAPTAPIAPEQELPEPPIPPAHPPSDTAAPVPDVDLYAPQDAPQEGPALKPNLHEHSPTLPGGDPVPGTLYRSDQEQRRALIPSPGIDLVVPLQK